MNHQKFGNFIIELRKENNMTQKELADKLHLTDKAISKWERGLSFPDISILKPLSEVLKVSIIELLNGEKENIEEIDIEARILTILEQKEQEKKKKIRKVIGISFLVILLSVAIFFLLIFSRVKLHTYNPIRAIIGYIQIIKFNKTYVEVGNIPTKTIYGGENFSIEEYMKENGYTKLEEFTIKSGDDLYTNGEYTIFIERWCRRGIAIYEFGSKRPYHEKWIEETKQEPEIKVPTLNEIDITLNEIGTTNYIPVHNKINDIL